MPIAPKSGTPTSQLFANAQVSNFILRRTIYSTYSQRTDNYE